MSAKALSPLIHKLETMLTLTNDEVVALDALPVRLKEFAKGEVVIREGERPTQSFTIIEGVTIAYKTSTEGRRQILLFHLAGDFPDLQSLHLNVLDMSIATVTRTRIGFVQHQDIRLLYGRFPRLGEALWRLSLLDTAILRERMLTLGQQTAYQRIAHFFCEIWIRMRLAGLADGDAVPLPFTQQETGDTLGLSNIHVNRITQELKDDKLIDTKRGRLIVLNWKKLEKAADFDATYLHLTPAQKILLTAT
jgi:CRP-like cAMP-binding protein